MRTWPCLHRSSRVAYNFPVYNIINEVSVKIFVVTAPSYYVLHNRYFFIRSIIIVIIARKTLFDNIPKTLYKGTLYHVEFTAVYIYRLKTFILLNDFSNLLLNSITRTPQKHVLQTYKIANVRSK